MIPSRSPLWTQQLLKGLTWRVKTQQKELYLTFDDGPIPELTPWVLDLLSSYKAKATFFCIGANAAKSRDIITRIKQEGHSLGHHTFNHYNAWKVTKEDYLENVAKGNKEVPSRLFRPPYGKLRRSMISTLKQDYEIVMWTVLSKDYLRSISSQQVLHNVLSCKAGDIIVFHDSLKAEKHLRYSLPKMLKHYHDKGFEFKALTA